jgi:alpha,alpha-trehalose phosphorylase
MIRRERVIPPEHIYPIDDWRLVQSSPALEFLAQGETIFSVANGYLGIRGTFEEGRPVHQPGTFVNGFFESWPIVYAEEAFGFAKTGQTMLNVTDASIVRLYVDDEPLFLPTATLIEFERALDMRSGTLDRTLVWETPSGKRVSVHSRRLASFEHRHLAAIRYEVTVLNTSAPVALISEVVGNPRNQQQHGDPRQARGFSDKVMQPQVGRHEEQRLIVGHQTLRSRMTLACGVDHVADSGCKFAARVEMEEDAGRVLYTIDALPGEPFVLTKYLAYHSSRSAPTTELAARAELTLDRACATGFAALVAAQRTHLDAFWERSDVQIVGAHPRAQQVMRFNLFQIYQAAARAEGSGIGARGLTGQAYDGHYFWDSEMYVVPFLTYTSPRIARNLLAFRHSTLDLARRRAEEVNQRGALFPWRTINGEEASAYYAAGTAQYHIDADISYAVRKYVQVSGDDEFLERFGAEILVECARLWEDLGFYSERAGGKFCIHGVTGPDEYNTVVNNNAYTNLMARENLWYAASTVEWLRDERPAHHRALVHRTGLRDEEVAAWRRAADQMYVPFDERLGIHPQDDAFLEREGWDLDSVPLEQYPLLLHFHPLVIYRHKVIKQADIALAMFLLGNHFSDEQKRRNFDYYDPLTTGDSSLSACVQAIVAAEIGDTEKANEYFRRAAVVDLADTAGNVQDGCHIASMAGTWMAVVYGFAGMRDYGGQISFDPHVPSGFRMAFRIQVRGRRLRVQVDHDTATYELLDGRELEIVHCGQAVAVALGTPRSLPNRRSAARAAVS